MTFGTTVIAVPPGESIKEQLENRGLSQKEFALRMGMSEKHISKLINGKTELTPPTAQKLESVLGIPARFWSNLEAIYREKLAKAQSENEMAKDIEASKNFPYAQMVKFKWVNKTEKSIERVEQLRKFFEVANLGVIDNLKIPGIAYRITDKSKKSDYALAAWAQRARIEARDVECSAINIQGLEKSLPSIRALTREMPKEFCPKLREILAACGIVIVFLPHIGGSFLHGASFVDGNHIVMGLTVRGKDADKFWFSLFHEIHHILVGDINNNSLITPEQENACDVFAQNQLIPESDYKRFVECRVFTPQSICSFANSVGIDRGIVVGRLQKENYIPYNRLNDLKTRYIIK